MRSSVSTRSMDFLRGFSGGMGAIPFCSSMERCWAAATAADLAGGGGGGSEILVGDRTRSGLNLTGLTFFGLTAGIGGKGGDLTGLPILLELRGFISGGCTECLIGGLGGLS